MAISIGDRLPNATFFEVGPEGHKTVSLDEKLLGRKVVIFAVAGAFADICNLLHLPGYMRHIGAFADKGVDEVICLSVNDPLVMKAWGKSTGAFSAGVTLLADTDSGFSTGTGMSFDFPDDGMISRSKRYAMVIEDGLVLSLREEVHAGMCEVSTASAMLELL